MGQSGGEEGQGAEPEESALPEGFEGQPADPALGLGVQALQPGAEPATNLDLLVAMNEPESLVKELKKIAEPRQADKRWLGIFRLCERAEEYFEHINKPKPNRPQP